MISSLGVGLIFRPRLIKCRELQADGIDCDNFWEFIKRYLVTPGICYLRYQTNIGKRDMSTVGVRRRREHGFQRRKTCNDPVVIPGIDIGLLMFELSFDVLQGNEIVERMNIAGDQ